MFNWIAGQSGKHEFEMSPTASFLAFLFNYYVVEKKSAGGRNRVILTSVVEFLIAENCFGCLDRVYFSSLSWLLHHYVGFFSLQRRLENCIHWSNAIFVLPKYVLVYIVNALFH